MKTTIFPIHTIGEGSLSIMAKPNSGDVIDQEFSNISNAGIHTIVSLLEPHESDALGLDKEKFYTEKYGMCFVSNPIVDRGLPSSTPEFSRFTRQLYTDMFDGANTLVHCHGGIGRSGLVAAAILLYCGFTGEQAFTYITEKRGVPVPDTDEQVDWIISHSASILCG